MNVNNPDHATRNTQHAALVQPLGDSALLVVFGDEIEVAVNARVHALAAAVNAEREAGGAGWGLAVPAYSSLLAPYDPLRWTYAQAADAMRGLLDALPAAPVAAPDAGEVVEIPVRYGGE